MPNISLTTVLAYFFGLCGLCCLVLSYQQTDRRKLLLGKLGSDIFWCVHYCLLAAWGGAIPNGLGAVRELVFRQRDKRKWASSPVIPFLFVLASWAVAILSIILDESRRTLWTLLPIAASTAVTFSLWARKPKVTRIICLPVSVCFIVYDIVVGSWIGIVNESIAIVSIIVSICRNDKQKKENTQ